MSANINSFKQKEVWTFFLFKEGNFSAKLNKSLSSRTNNRWVSHWIGQRTGWHDFQIQFQIRKIQKTSFKASMTITRITKDLSCRMWNTIWHWEELVWPSLKSNNVQWIMIVYSFRFQTLKVQTNRIYGDSVGKVVAHAKLLTIYLILAFYWQTMKHQPSLTHIKT